MAHRYVNPPDVWDSTPHGFSQAVVAGAGRTVHISGQVAWDPGRAIGAGDLATQARMSLRNLERVLTAAGARLTDVVELRIYLVAERGDPLTGVGEALLEAFGAGTGPAATWILVRGLADPEFLIEIEATAVIADVRRARLIGRRQGAKARSIRNGEAPLAGPNLSSPSWTPPIATI